MGGKTTKKTGNQNVANVATLILSLSETIMSSNYRKNAGRYGEDDEDERPPPTRPPLTNMATYFPNARDLTFHGSHFCDRPLTLSRAQIIPTEDMSSLGSDNNSQCGQGDGLSNDLLDELAGSWKDYIFENSANFDFVEKYSISGNGAIPDCGEDEPGADIQQVHERTIAETAPRLESPLSTYKAQQGSKHGEKTTVTSTKKKTKKSKHKHKEGLKIGVEPAIDGDTFPTRVCNSKSPEKKKRTRQSNSTSSPSEGSRDRRRHRRHESRDQTGESNSSRRRHSKGRNKTSRQTNKKVNPQEIIDFVSGLKDPISDGESPVKPDATGFTHSGAKEDMLNRAIDSARVIPCDRVPNEHLQHCKNPRSSRKSHIMPDHNPHKGKYCQSHPLTSHQKMNHLTRMMVKYVDLSNLQLLLLQKSDLRLSNSKRGMRL